MTASNGNIELQFKDINKRDVSVTRYPAISRRLASRTLLWTLLCQVLGAPSYWSSNEQLREGPYSRRHVDTRSAAHYKKARHTLCNIFLRDRERHARVCFLSNTGSTHPPTTGFKKNQEDLMTMR